MTCSYCGSKKHNVETCLVGKLPRPDQPREVWTKDEHRFYNMGWWEGIEEHERMHPKIPSISVKELSYLISLARKNVLKRHRQSINFNCYLVEASFCEVQKQLNLRKRGRKCSQ